MDCGLHIMYWQPDVHSEMKRPSVYVASGCELDTAEACRQTVTSQWSKMDLSMRHGIQGHLQGVFR